VLGLGFVALFAAAMSSIDSVLNSLSAASLEDFVKPRVKRPLSDAQTLIVARVLTALWGILTLGFTFLVGDIADTVIVAINKIGSLINGPILGVFLLGLLTQVCIGERGAIRVGFGLVDECRLLALGTFGLVVVVEFNWISNDSRSRMSWLAARNPMGWAR
jgi:Na+/proline symporter